MSGSLVARRRYARPMRLADVGAEAQEKWLAAEARVHGEAVAARVEALYLVGAGLGKVAASPAVAAAARALNSTVRVEDAPPNGVAESGPSLGLDPAAEAVALGAFAALRTLKAVLSV